MKTEREPRAGTAGGKSRKHRPRPVPKWLVKSTALDAIARSRVMLVLSVLSGEVPVTDAIAQAKVSRGTYYHWETRAVKAMLAALNPMASSAPDGSADLSAATARIESLEATVKRLTQEKRRSQRLWLLTQKTVRGPVSTGRRGRWPKSGIVSTSTPPGASSP